MTHVLHPGPGSLPQLHSPTQRSHRASRQVQTRAQPQAVRPCQEAVGTSAHHSHLPDAHVTRRQALATTALASSLAILAPSPAARAEPGQDAALLERVTPQVAPAALTPKEQQVIDVFNSATYSVVNIYDVALAGRVGNTPEVDRPEGNGSGIVWDKSGNVLTNYHVLGTSLKALGDKALGARVARVQLLGRGNRSETYDGTLVGLDRARDLAVVKVNVPAEQLQPVTLGTSSQLRVGQQVLAIGCPFGFDHTLSAGVVSGLNREIRSIVGTTIPGGIQTDAAINPGNSGGPLLNSAGQLIGVNTAIFTNTGTSVGIGFAIPVDTVARVVPQLIANGKVTRPSLGVQIASEQTASRLNIKKGALIQSVNPDGAGQKAGLLPTRRGLSGIIAGDVILQVDDLPVNNPPDLINALDVKELGQTVTLKILRAADNGAQELSVKAVLGSE